jgi:hypothetical protein
VCLSQSKNDSSLVIWGKKECGGDASRIKNQLDELKGKLSQ